MATEGQAPTRAADAPAPSGGRSPRRSRSRSPRRNRSRSPRRSRSRSRSRRRSRSPRRSRSRSGGRRGGALREGQVQGVATRWNNERGFGFIKPNDNSEDVFCHVSCIEDGNALREGDTVTYYVNFDDRRQKYRAERVTGGITLERNEGGFGGGRPAGMCYDFQAGRCNRGSSCRFSHGDDGGGRGGGGYGGGGGGGYGGGYGGGGGGYGGGGYDGGRGGGGGGYDGGRGGGGGGYDGGRGGGGGYNGGGGGRY